MMQYVVLSGSLPVDIKTSPLIVLSFFLPAITELQFYSADVVGNLAIFLGIPAGKIKIANVMRATVKRLVEGWFNRLSTYERRSPRFTRAYITVLREVTPLHQLRNRKQETIDWRCQGVPGNRWAPDCVAFGVDNWWFN